MEDLSAGNAKLQAQVVELTRAQNQHLVSLASNAGGAPSTPALGSRRNAAAVDAFVATTAASTAMATAAATAAPARAADDFLAAEPLPVQPARDVFFADGGM